MPRSGDYPAPKISLEGVLGKGNRAELLKSKKLRFFRKLRLSIKLTNRKSLLTVGLVMVTALVLSARLAWAQNGKNGALQLIDKLYSPSGLMPIRDLVIELESYDFSKDNNAFVLSSNDKLYYKYPNKLRVDSILSDPGGPMDKKEAILIRDGVTALYYISMGQYPVKKAPDLPSATLNLPFHIQQYTVDAAKKYTIKGKKNIEGAETTEILIENPQDANNNITVYIDSNRLVPLRLDAIRISDKEKILLRVDYKDIKKLSDGRFFPHKIEIYENDVHKKTRVYKGVQANCGLDDSMFSPMNGIMNPQQSQPAPQTMTQQ